MYQIPYFKEPDPQVLQAFMRENPFVLLSGCDGAHRPVATHIPLLLEERSGQLFLMGHMMRNSDHHRAFVQNPAVLAIFSGPHCYVSASWYSEPRTASTWNYMTVHARGNLHFLDSPEELLGILRRTTAHFEKVDSGSLVENMAPEYVQKMMKAIIGFEVKVEALDNVFKLSQNRDRNSYENIIRELEKQGGEAAAVAREMGKRRLQLFKE